MKDINEIPLADRVAVLEYTLAAIARAIGMPREAYTDLIEQSAAAVFERNHTPPAGGQH